MNITEVVYKKQLRKDTMGINMEITTETENKNKNEILNFQKGKKS